ADHTFLSTKCAVIHLDCYKTFIYTFLMLWFFSTIRILMNDYELFIKINDAILLEFDVFKPWEKTMLLSTQNQMMDKYPLSEEQIQLLNKVLNKKRTKKRRKK
ncbi:hypothetical protein, partial [Aliivibrio fischeri]